MDQHIDKQSSTNDTNTDGGMILNGDVERHRPVESDFDQRHVTACADKKKMMLVLILQSFIVCF